MIDLSYDIEKMEIGILAGDFYLGDDSSQQNGGLLLYTKNLNLEFPLFGVGMGDTLNASVQIQQNYLNRWQSQCLADGAKAASWQMEQDKDNNLIFRTQCNYNA
jgi:hypothetical protein